MDSADEDMVPPPLPDEEPKKPPTPPPLPPLSMQTSNQVRDGLDFDSDVGGQHKHLGETPQTRISKTGESQGETTEEEGEIADSDDGENGRRAAKVESQVESVSLEDGEIQEASRNILRKRKAAETSTACKKSKWSHSTSDLTQPFADNPAGNSACEAIAGKEQCPYKAGGGDGNKVETSQSDAVNFAGDEQLQFVSFESSSQSIVQHAHLQNNGGQVADQGSAKQGIAYKESLAKGDQESNTLLSKQEFEIIDDIGSDDEGPYEFDSDMDEDEIEALLDEGLQQYRMRHDGSDAGSNEEEEFAAPIEREKVVLKERGQDPFDILPEGWVTVTHNSGMPVYLHKQTRVCTLSRPYFLGPGSARKHDIPLSAIPCLQYRRELDKEVNRDSSDESSMKGDTSLSNGDMSGQAGIDGPIGATSEENSQSGADAGSQTGSTGDNGDDKGQGPNVRVESLEKYNKDKTMGPLELREYCERLFEFQTITVKKYKTWKDRRKHHKLLKVNSRPSLPSNTKLITCPILVNKQEDKPNRKKEFVLNPAGKSDICILHEYVQHAMRVQPRYIIKELENAQTPYSATVIINQVEYGTGYASSKKAAKNEAAKVTLGILIPELKKVSEKTQDIHDLSFFDEVKIEDPRVHELCNKAGQPGPFQILCECLRRNFGMGDTNCQMDMKTLKHQKSEFTMRVGKHSATVICKNKREGKQLAAQAILQRLHPHIHSWGSLLRLYGTDWKAIKEKEEELSVTSLHAKAKQHQPNTAILNKLKEEMEKLQMRREAMKSNIKGKLELEGIPAMTSVPGVDL